MASESGLGQQLILNNLNSLEKLTIEGDSPVAVMINKITGLVRFRSPLLTESQLISFPLVT